MDIDYPSNSRAPKQDETEIPEQKKVVTGKVITRKPTIGRRLKGMFLGGDARSVFDYVLDDVLLPAARDMIADAFTQSVERMIFGEARRGGPRRGPDRSSSVFGGSTNRTPYDRMSSRRDERPMSRRARANHDFDEIIIPSRAEAEEVLERLELLIDKYDQASVKDLYELVGENYHFTDEKWGWTNSRGFAVRRTSAGYLLDLPKTEPLD